MIDSSHRQSLIDQIVSHGFNEQAAVEVVDFLGERVYPGVKESKIKRRSVTSKDPS